MKKEKQPKHSSNWLIEEIKYYYGLFMDKIRDLLVPVKETIGGGIKKIQGFLFNPEQPFQKALSGVSNLNKILSPKKLVLQDKIVFFIAMFLFSFLVIALETIQFHVLLVVTNYLKATFIISIAMLGIAIGSLIGFYLNRFNIHRVMFVSSILLFFSVILAYYNIINIGSLDYPYLLILPFLFASINISMIFTRSNSNIAYFTNLIASALGVLFPIVFLPYFKSEGSMMLLMLVPLVFVGIQSFRIPNLIVKGSLAIAALIVIVMFSQFILGNMSVPETIPVDVFEKKIMLEFDQDAGKQRFYKNIPDEFFRRVYVLNKEQARYVFTGDEYDLRRAEYFLKVLGFKSRWGIGQIPFLENRPMIDTMTSLEKEFFETKLEPLLEKKFLTFFERNYDLLFMRRVFKKNDDGNYHMIGDSYDEKRARYLLTQLGHMETVDLNFDVRYHPSLQEIRKIYTVPDRLLLSEDSTLGRLEYTGGIVGGMSGIRPESDFYYMYMNGVALDSIDAYNGSYKDPRVPWMTDSPKLFIVGLSADGIVKSCRRLPGATVSGIEINHSIYRTMIEDGPFAYAAGFAYKDVTAYRGEGRGFLQTTTETYDQIYLMNIHMEHGPVSTLSPENFHTVEATKLLLNKITDRGYVVYEEIIENFRSQQFLYKMMNTLKTAMKESGITDLSKHFYIYKWGFSPGSDIFRTIIIKKTPFNLKEKRTLDKYLDTITTREPFSAYNVQMVFDPYGKRYGNELERFILEDIENQDIFPRSLQADEFQNKIMKHISEPDDIGFMLSRYVYNNKYNRYYYAASRFSDEDTSRLSEILNKAEYSYQFDYTPVTDDQPFPYNIHVKKYEVLEILKIVLLLSLLLIVPVVLLVLSKQGKYKMNLVVPNLFMAATGFGYMLVEIVLMQMFQRFIGLPTYALIVTLGGLLLFSGIGSFLSRFFNRILKIAAALMIPVILFIMLNTLDSIFASFTSASFEIKMVISVLLLFPVTFLMGIPFPNALEIIRKHTSAEYGALMFGVSGAFSTIGATVGILLNVTYGYSMSFWAGIACYSAGLVFFVIIMLKKKKEA